MKVFGDWKGTTFDHCDTPVGELCLMCGKPFAAGDVGVSMPCVDFDGSCRIGAQHKYCFFESVLGPHNPLAKPT